MKVQSLPQFINRDHMVFVKNYTEDELLDIYLMKEQGKVERIEILGTGRVVWFYDRRDAMMFMLGNRI